MLLPVTVLQKPSILYKVTDTSKQISVSPLFGLVTLATPMTTGAFLYLLSSTARPPLGKGITADCLTTYV